MPVVRLLPDSSSSEWSKNISTSTSVLPKQKGQSRTCRPSEASQSENPEGSVDPQIKQRASLVHAKDLLGGNGYFISLMNPVDWIDHSTLHYSIRQYNTASTKHINTVSSCTSEYL